MANGHQEAAHYPLMFMLNEARFSRQHQNAMLRSQALLTHAVVGHALSGGDHLKETLERLDDGTD